jgi:uncharacterized membrane protein YeaQ/YmgE (transglycosylase-associated protein family)
MNIVVWLVVGVSVGWIGSLMIGTDSREELIRNVIFGTVGAFVGSWILGLASQASAGVSAGGVIASIAGAVALMFVAKRFRSA